MREPCRPELTPIKLPEVGDVFIRGITIVEQLSYIYAQGVGPDDGDQPIDPDAPISKEQSIANLQTLMQMAEDMVVDKEGEKIWFAHSWGTWVMKYPDDKQRLFDAINDVAGFKVEDAKKD